MSSPGNAAPVSWAPRLMAVLRIPRLTLRSQLTLLYAGLFLAAGIAALAIPVFTIRTSLPAGATASTIALTNASARTQVIRAAATLAALVAVSLPVRMADRRPVPAATADDHRDRPGYLGQQPEPAPGPRRPG